MFAYRIIGDPYSERFVILENTSRVAVSKTEQQPGKVPSRCRTAVFFDVSSPAPTLVHKSPDNILAGIFVLGDENRASKFLFMGRNLALCSPDEPQPGSVGSNSGNTTPADQNVGVVQGHNSTFRNYTLTGVQDTNGLWNEQNLNGNTTTANGHTAYTRLFAPSAPVLSHEGQSSPIELGSAREAAAVLGGAVHTAPPIDRLLPAMLALLLPQRQQTDHRTMDRPEKMCSDNELPSTATSTAIPRALLDDSCLCGLGSNGSLVDWSTLCMTPSPAPSSSGKGKARKHAT